ncbi:phosphopantothenoylcysteine decarboxylase complex subunit CAB3 NDAI_0C00310 [Naumovozyma dairenensis CBS 421]|uniref:Flavoprotein domain-containing protein n=1 Tax=Naumovozyma dairenensis (strain ATCC 10597 / BCRC 20456 / CBS 421 / NBRC 0211 / NRRL Y-12639) TaxID=1071378 RepID=G0W7D1_NAUDC|nr:hypothetical protein NDAI_0C00310 [Naumovozyma dairenensis CBS 421]CCD23692.1 hypothetical protein NDAI_0C00310 [Naumovozyma dairenensis CBS 421]
MSQNSNKLTTHGEPSLITIKKDAATQPVSILNKINTTTTNGGKPLAVNDTAKSKLATTIEKIYPTNGNLNINPVTNPISNRQQISDNQKDPTDTLTNSRPSDKKARLYMNNDINNNILPADQLRSVSNVSIKTAVSFSTNNENEKQLHHRYSISNKPTSKNNSQENLNNNNNNNNHRLSIDTTGVNNKKVTSKTKNEDNIQDDGTLEEKNSIVHMPGDFIYLEPKTPTSSSIDSNNKQITQSHARLITPHRNDTASTIVGTGTATTTSTATVTPATNSSTHNTKSNVKNPKEIIGTPKGPQIPFYEFFQKQDDKKIHILMGTTGSVATIKVPLIIDKLFKIYTPERVSIQLIVTKPAEHFLKGLKISSHVKIWREEDVWYEYKLDGNEPILHHELRKWADILLIAPLSANTLAKIANGICNNLLTSVLRDWSPLTPVLVAPAMNTFMYINPMTKKHLTILQNECPYVTILKPMEKVLICGDIGMGGMREWTDIVEIMRKRINELVKIQNLSNDLTNTSHVIGDNKANIINSNAKDLQQNKKTSTPNDSLAISQDEVENEENEDDDDDDDEEDEDEDDELRNDTASDDSGISDDDDDDNDDSDEAEDEDDDDDDDDYDDDTEQDGKTEQRQI